jgi:hypothetical protein
MVKELLPPFLKFNFNEGADISRDALVAESGCIVKQQAYSSPGTARRQTTEERFL